MKQCTWLDTHLFYISCAKHRFECHFVRTGHGEDWYDCLLARCIEVILVSLDTRSLPDTFCFHCSPLIWCRSSLWRCTTSLCLRLCLVTMLASTWRTSLWKKSVVVTWLVTARVILPRSARLSTPRYFCTFYCSVTCVQIFLLFQLTYLERVCRTCFLVWKFSFCPKTSVSGETSKSCRKPGSFSGKAHCLVLQESCDINSSPRSPARPVHCLSPIAGNRPPDTWRLQTWPLL